MTTEIKINDNVYWNIRVGMFPRTISGKVTGFDEKDPDYVLGYQTTQNTHGKPFRKHKNTLTIKKSR